MNWNDSFTRKIVYIVLLAALIFPLAYLGLPASRGGSGANPGGVLAQLRAEQGLAQANLGEIDPASEAIRLATLGMQGVATVFLWTAADEYKMKADFDNYGATLNQLVKLQPHFIDVWINLSWNESFNVSVEFDDYRQRYHWVKRGMDRLMQGTRYNHNDTKLLGYIAWVFGQKIGKSDEHRQFRRLFAADVDFHNRLRDEGVPIDQTLGPKGKPDNWKVCQQWHLKAEQAAAEGRPIRGASNLLFYSFAPMAMMSFAEAIEKEGHLDEYAAEAWRTAGKQWHEYGSRSIPTSWGVNIHLNDLDRGGEDGRGMEGAVERLQAELDALAPGVRDRLIAERREKLLTPQERLALDKPAHQRTTEEEIAVYGANEKLKITPYEIAQAAPEANRARARALAAQIRETEETISYVQRYRDIVNFSYWRVRCEVEQSDDAVTGRKHLREAYRLYNQVTDFEGAREQYELAFAAWGKIHEKYPELKDDVTADDLFDEVEHYREVLEQLRIPFQRNFPLRHLLDRKEVTWHLVGEAEPSDMPPATDAAPPAADVPAAPDATPPADAPANDTPANDAPPTAETPAAEAPAAEPSAPAEVPPADAPPAEVPPADAPPSPADNHDAAASDSTDHPQL